MNIMLYLVLCIIGVIYGAIQSFVYFNKESNKKVIKKKIIIELFYGILFMIIGKTLRIDLYEITRTKIINFVFLVIYFTFIFHLSIADKKSRKVEKNVMFLTILFLIVYIIYSYVLDKTCIYKYGLYLISLIILLLLDTIVLKRKAQENYYIELVIILLLMEMFASFEVTLITLLVAIFAIYIIKFIYKIKNSKKNVKEEKQTLYIPIIYIIGISHIIVLISSLFYINYF